MPDIDKILEQLLSDPRLQHGRAFTTSKTYSDEPIIRRGSTMRGFTPEPIKQLRQLQHTTAGRTWSETRLFYEQARLLEDYEDHAPYSGEFVSYYPTYRSMSDAQLRGYFTWRTAVRRGDVEKTSTSFAYVYIFELLMGIGCEPGIEGFKAIESFYQAFREFDQIGMDRNVRPWLVDYVVGHALDPKFAEPYADTSHDRAIALLEGIDHAAVLSAPAKGSRRSPLDFGTLGEAAAKLADAADALSTYHVKTSKFYKERPDDLELVLCAVFIRLARRYARTHNQGLTETLFGTRFSVRHLMYAAAVHYEPQPHSDCTYELNKTRSYTCRNGSWTCDGYHDGGARSAKLGEICRVVDRVLRDGSGYAAPLKEHGEPKYLVKMVEAEVADYLSWKEAHKKVVIDIDLSKLSGIRAAASSTCEALLVDEERETGEVPPSSPSSNSPDSNERDIKSRSAHAELRAEMKAEPPTRDPSPTEQAVERPFGLTEDECLLLIGLVKKEELLLRDRAESVNLLVDSINEKMFDLLGDTAVEFGEDGAPRVVEDYAEDLQEALEL